MNSSNVRAVLASAAVYAAATAAMGRELLASLGSAIASDVGDPVLNAAILAWNARTVPWTDAWFNFPAFYPAPDALTFSEHLLGVSVIASPLYWLGGDAVAAYNLTLLLGYVLSGLAMFALVRRLTGNSLAAFIAGAAFAFAPYRAAQLPHIQVGIVCWAPLALLGLHAYVETGRRRWLVLFGLGWMLQGAANGYFLVFFSVLVGFWVMWFVISEGRWRQLAMIAVALLVASVPLIPILARFVAAHAHYGLSRPPEEIASFGADVAGLLCASPHLAAWGWLQLACRPEGELFPGLTIAVLCSVGAVVTLRGRGNAIPAHASGRHIAMVAGAALTIAVLITLGIDDALQQAVTLSSSSIQKPLVRGLVLAGVAAAWWAIARRSMWRTTSAARVASWLIRIVGYLLILATVLFIASAVSVAVVGPWEWTAEPTDIVPSLITTILVASIVTIAWLWRRSSGTAARASAVGFYLVAALSTWILAWGPSPVLDGEPMLPQGPYAWLLLVPGLDGLRVPARFWMMTTICLSVLAGYAGAAILERRSSRVATTIAAFAVAAFVLDGWATMPAARLLPSPPNPDLLRGAVVLTLPLGSNRDIDIAAQFAAVTGGWLSINGFSGYEPFHYGRLRHGSSYADPVIFSPFRARGDLHVVVHDNANSLLQLVERQPGATEVARSEGWRQYRMPRAGRLPPREASGKRLPIAAVEASCSTEMVPLVTDGDPATRWECGPQKPEQQLTIDLGMPMMVANVVPGVGRFPTDFPRHLRIETSVDGTRWDRAWDGGVLAELIEAEFDDPAANRLVLAFASRPARYIRLRLMSADEVWYWSIAELEVWSGSA